MNGVMLWWVGFFYGWIYDRRGGVISIGRKVRAIGGHLLAHETGVRGSAGSIFPRGMTDYHGYDGMFMAVYTPRV